MPAITSFRGRYAFLSNFYRHPMKYAGLTWPTLEHAYQAIKTTSPKQRAAIARAATPGMAKARGQRVVLRPDWDRVKIDIMRELLRVKFSVSSPLRYKLLDTHPHLLEEANTWGDTFWGTSDGLGENWLGRLLVERRERLRKIL